MKANVLILYVGQLERWRSSLRRKLLLLVVFVFVELDGWALLVVLLIRGASDFSSRQRLCNRIEASQAIFVCFVQSKIPLSFVSSPFLWSEFLCMIFFRKFIPLFALLF